MFRKKKSRRRDYPEHLPRVRTTVEIPPEERICDCGEPMAEIDEEVTRELERIEITVVHEIVRKKYACKRCEAGVLTAAAPTRPIPKGMLGPGFLSHVITERFANHMPYYRLSKKYESEGLDLSRQVLSSSMGRVSELLEPIYDVLGESVIRSDVIFTDDTPVVVLESAGGGKRLGRFWAHVDLEGTHYLTFSESRSRDEPMRVLGGFKGWMHADAFKGYETLYMPEGAIHVGCMAHARRYFERALDQEPELADQALNRIGALYGKEGKELTPEERLKLRRARAGPLLEELRAWLALTETKVLPKGAMAKAIRYTLSQWDSLVRYLEDGRLKIDNNTAENAVRPIALGRKNWLFVGNEHGGKTACVLMSILRTAMTLGLNVREYFRDILLRMAGAKESEKRELARELIPSRWKQRFEPEIRDHQASILERWIEQAKAASE